VPTIDRLEGPIPRVRLTEGRTFVELAPSRGGLVTAFVVEGEPVLYLDEATLLDETKSVRGGVPLLFPIAGKPPEGSKLKQHGFLRNLPWKVTSAVADDATARVECELESNEETLALWPFPFEATLAVSLFDRRMMLEFSFHNTGSQPMPLHFGIHPYFVVGEKALVNVEGTEGQAFDNVSRVEREITQVDYAAGEVDLHFSPFDRRGTTLTRGDGKRVTLSWTEQFDTLVVWTLPGKPFVCVEPWTAKGQAPASLFVSPGETERLAVAVTLES
jgi:galactose mutarotase-like enzyme